MFSNALEPSYLTKRPCGATSPRKLAAYRGLLLATLLSPMAQRALAGESDQTLETIVVTAEKRSESLQDVAGAVSVLTNDELQKMGVDNFRDFATSVPGLTFVPTSSSTTKIVMRGISSGNNYDAASSATGLYLDDVPLGSSYGSGGTEISLVDLQRVEVLRGPQGTLYGAGSEGGTVKYVTSQPDLKQFSGFSAVTGGTTAGAASEAVDAVVNIPLVQDALGIRAVGYYRNSDGYIADPTIGENGVNNSTIWGGRVSALWVLNDRFSISAFGLAQTTEDGAPNLIDTNVNKQPLAGDLAQPLSTVPTPSTIHSTIGNAVIKYDFDWATLTASTSYTHFMRAQGVDDTPIALGATAKRLVPGLESVPEVFSTTERSYVEEVRLTSASESPLKWLGGLFYRNYNLQGERDLSLQPNPGFSALDLQLGSGFKDFAVFGEGTYAFTHAWALTLGGRYSTYTSSATQSLVGLFVPGHLLSPLAQPQGSIASDAFTPKAELSFRPGKDQLLYALVSEGYRAGGPNLAYPAPITAVPPTYKPDTTWNYELGAKTSWLDERLTANVAVFYEAIKDLQVVQSIPGFGLPYLTNAGKAKSQGVELEVQARPIHALTLAGTATYDEAEFTTDAPALNAVVGDQIPQIPHWTITVAADYQMPVGDNLSWFGHIDYRYVGSSPASDVALAKKYNIQLDAYRAANARIGIDYGANEASFFVDNLTDVRAELNILVADAVIPPNLRITILEPRTFGIRLSHKF